MRRILVVVGLMALLAVAIAVPAMAQSSPNNVLRSLLPDLPNAAVPFGGPSLDNTPLGEFLFGPPTTDSNDEITEPFDSRSVDDSSNTDDLIIVDPNGSNSDPAASQEFSESRIQSGSASPSSSFSNTGDNVNACPTTQQVVNTGNVANQQGIVQYNATSDDVDLTGSSISIGSSATATCTQTIDQAAASK
jgi:hypothetical protein